MTQNRANYPGVVARRRPTMKEIADRAGVNKSTVSRVLSGRHPGSASLVTAEQIRQVASELGYQVDPWAASLRTQRTQTIGVLIPRLTDIVLAMIFEAIDDAATAAGYQVLVASTGDSAVEQRRRIELLERRRVDGLIVMTGHLGDEEYFDELSQQGLQFVLANRAVGRHPVVRANDHDGGRQATQHLLSLGHHRIGVIAGPEYAPTAVDRVKGYREAIAAAGVDANPDLVVHSGVEVDAGEQATRRLLSLSPPPSAIFAVNDFAAMGALSTIREAGYRAGTDIAVVGYNDIPLCARLPIPLSSVHHPVPDIGRLAVAALLTLLNGSVPESVALPVRLSVRQSSQPALGENFRG